MAINGGPGNDSLSGTAGNDSFVGNAGNDTIDGDGGTDTASFGGTVSGYLFESVGGRLVVRDAYADNGNDGVDTLMDVERVVFADRTFSVLEPAGPFGEFVVHLEEYGNQFNPEIVVREDGGFTMSWQSTTLVDDWEPELAPQGEYARDFDAMGRPTGPEYRVGNENFSVQPPGPLVTVTLANGDLLQAQSRPGQARGYDVYAQRFTADGVPVGAEVTGTALADKMYGGAGTIVFHGGDGNDILKGGADRDVLHGDAGNDTLDGGTGADAMFGGAGNDIYHVDSDKDRFFERATASATDTVDTGGIDTVISTVSVDLGFVQGTRDIENLVLMGTATINGQGNALANILTGNAVNNTLSGAGGHDRLEGLAGIDRLNGENGSDTLDGGAGQDFMAGGAGNDSYYVDDVGDRVYETATTNSADTVDAGGTDFVYSTVSFNLNRANGERFVEHLTLQGTDAIDGRGNALANRIIGNVAANALDGGVGADSLIGGRGDDTYTVDNVGDVVTERAGEGADVVLSYLTSYTLGANIEVGRIVRSGNANMTGNTLDNVIYAGVGSNLIDGGAGIDTVSYLYASAGVTATLATTTGQVTGGSSTDTLRNLENLTGSDYADVLGGDVAANILDGGLGADRLSGGRGNDLYRVDDVGDVVQELADGGTDTVYTTATRHVLGANVEIGRIATDETADLTGNAGANTIYAGRGDNVLVGGAGIDTLSYANGIAGTTGVRVSLALQSTQATGGSGRDTVSQFENLAGSAGSDRLTGDALANTLRGLDGADTLAGGAGNDVLLGGLGADSLVGGAGADRFDFDAIQESGLSEGLWDVIADFGVGDRIDLSGIDANSATSANDAFNGTLVSRFTAAGQLRFDAAAQVLYGNTDADAAAEFAIRVSGVTGLDSGDFIL